MKTLAEAAMELPWLAPSAASLTVLAKAPLSQVWLSVRTDPGVVLLLARLCETSNQSIFPAETTVLEALLRHRAHFSAGFVDWSKSSCATIHASCCRIATLASQLARANGVDEEQAWIAGFLVPLGQLALAAVEPAAKDRRFDVSSNATSIARRLCRAWRLPAWLSTVIGQLNLPVSIAQNLGAPIKLFQIVQLATALVQAHSENIGLAVGAKPVALANALDIPVDAAESLAQGVVEAPIAPTAWQAPANCPLLADLLELALENRRLNDSAWIERLQFEIDCLQQALVQQSTEEKDRVQTAKLSALAEFAAGAGHEINNPLAVISGQAQYVLKQMDWLDVPAEEIENVAEYMDGFRTKVTPSLNKIIGQTQRIHTILTDLMHFARPSKPKPQSLSARSLVHEVLHSLQSLADQRKVQLVPLEPGSDDTLYVDPGQARTALHALVRNAIEAAPAGGWARVRVERTSRGLAELTVEDNGGGPPATIQEHLFDPFFSGRSAGRGRGMGLPTAWRFAQQQGGDVRFAGHDGGVTRFVLALPSIPIFGIAALAA